MTVPHPPIVPVVVAVDGPAGSGKSSVSKEVASRLGFGFLDTGAAYRALAWHAEASGVDTEDAASVASCLPSFAYRIGTDPAGYAVHVGDIDVTNAIRDPAISAVVSRVARVPEVRAHLIELFRAIMVAEHRPGIVVEGRDITTVVAPDADVRILLTATPSERVNRRAREVHGRDDESALAATRDQVVRRDADDSSVAQFLEAAAGVVELDTSTLTLEQVIATVLRLVEEATSHSADGRHAPTSVGKSGPA
jgi:CMP/dCMP kinase